MHIACRRQRVSKILLTCWCRWAVFESPTAVPWSFGGVRAAHSNDCNCECRDTERCLREGKSPLKWANGLVAQHICRNDTGGLVRWQKVCLC